MRPDVPAMLSTIVLRLLEKNPDNRYQTVDGLIADLRRCQATMTAEGDIARFTGQQDRTPAIHLANALFRPSAGQ
jgi:serine/threonine protein kinase